jgi:hypothetical protein
LVTTVVTPANVVVGRVAVELVRDSLPASRRLERLDGLDSYVLGFP